jgi:GT2 family glycosyltransferase
MRNSEQLPDLSVVIATLGGASLDGTLQRLNCGSVRPMEILVCIPEKEAAQIKIALADNVTIIATSMMGQVAQRAEGLSRAKGSYVMQMDDDVYLEDGSLDRLLSSLQQMGRGNVVAPLYKNPADNHFITQFHSGSKGWLPSVEARLLCSAPWGLQRMGKLTSLGIGYWVDPRYIQQDEFEVEWLPGGCVICAREDLVTDNYYPLAGKAYTEDVVHSIRWRERGCQLWVIVTASCYTEIAPLVLNTREILSNFRARMYAASLLRGNRFRLSVWFVLYLLRRLFSALRFSF